MLGNTGSILDETYPKYNEAYTQESSFEYPVMINGKLRTKITFPVDMQVKEIQEKVMQNEVVQKWAEGRPAKKIIVVPGKIVNIVF